jgi:hypothetical protein
MGIQEIEIKGFRSRRFLAHYNLGELFTSGQLQALV